MRIYSLKVSEDLNIIEATLTRTLKPHATPVVVLAVDRTGTLLATGAADGNIKVWDLLGGYVTHTFRGPSVLVSALHFFEIASGRLGEEQTTSSKKGKKARRKSDVDGGEAKQDATIRFRLASGSQDGKVRVWDLHKRAVVADLESHVSDVQALDYSASQHALVTASRDKTMIWWDAKSWTARKIIPTFETIEAAGFVEDGRLTYTVGANGCVRLWETDAGREVTTEQAARAEGDAIVGAALCTEQNLLLTVQTDHTLVMYQIPSMRESLTIPEIEPLEPLGRISGTHDEIIDLAYLLPDRSLMALATNSEEVRLVSVTESSTEEENTGSRTYFGQDVGLLQGHDDIVITLDTDWSGHWIATGAKDNTARLWKVDSDSSCTCWATFTGHAETLGAISLPKTVPQESSAAYQDPSNHPPPFLVTGSQDLTVKKWEIPRQAQKKAKAVFTRKAHDKDINAVDINPTGQFFASSSQDKTVKIWSVAEGEVQGILRGHKRGVWSVKFAPANTPVIQGDKGAIAGKGLILTGSGDKTVKIWSLSDYTCIRTFEGHSNSILKVAWLNQYPEGDKSKRVQFASAGGDGLVKVWEANSGETETTLDNHEDRVWALTVHPETNMVVSGSADSTVTFWKDTSSATQAQAAQAATKLIEQEQELENYMHTGAYRDAIALALQLNHPGRLLGLFTSVVTASQPDAGSLCGSKAVDEVLATLSDEQLFLLLLRLRDWNTNARTAPVAQRILWTLVRSYPASKFSNLSVKGARGQKSLKEVLNALKVYTERHYKRMEELVDESYLVEYTLQEMEDLAPALEPVAGTNGDVLMLDAAS